MTDDSNSKIKLIKKYKNRRLYDTERSQYITMEELQAYVFQDVDFRVLDATTGKDLTNATLLQIFVELETNATQALPSKVLRQLITLSKHPLSQQYKTMLEEMLTKIQDQHLYLHHTQDVTELWMKQSEQFVKSWQDWLRNKGE